MKKLTLSIKQEQQFSEMRLKLFPNTVAYIAYDVKGLYVAEKDSIHQDIHWYEFTIRFLSQTIFEQLSTVDEEISPLTLARYQQNFGSALLMQGVHPIDYLYELYLESL